MSYPPIYGQKMAYEMGIFHIFINSSFLKISQLVLQRSVQWSFKNQKSEMYILPSSAPDPAKLGWVNIKKMIKKTITYHNRAVRGWETFYTRFKSRTDQVLSFHIPIKHYYSATAWCWTMMRRPAAIIVFIIGLKEWYQ